MTYTFFDDLAKTPEVEKPAQSLYRRFGKRVLDVALVLMVLPIVLPLILLAWLLTKRDGGNGFYTQPRIGLNGKHFSVWKIRSMVPDAEKVLVAMIESDAAIRDEWENAQKLENDPRITTLGRLMRMTSVDELPQLWNVLIGDMSLVGPRPFTPDQKTIYDGSATERAYYSLRPGISGLWQVECRNVGSFQDRVRYDEQYSNSLSFSKDVGIIFRTLKVIVQATGK